MEISPEPKTKRRTKKKSRVKETENCREDCFENCTEKKSPEHCTASTLREMLQAKIKGMQKDRRKGNSKTQETFNPEF